VHAELDCSYDDAADRCVDAVEHGSCVYWSCIKSYCANTWVHDTTTRECANVNLQDGFPADVMNGPSQSDPVDCESGAADESCQVRSRASSVNSSAIGSAMLVADSPCYAHSNQFSAGKIKHLIHSAAMSVYFQRAHEHYVETAGRWSGIDKGICPPKAPPESDCSSSVTWEYWTVFGKAKDFLNDEAWKAGYTGTLVTHGAHVATAPHGLQVGDLCFYYQPMHHVAIYTGGGKVVSHGEDPVGHYPVEYAYLDQCRRYL